MKLRNKKTGEIEELGCIHLLAKNSKTINAYKRLVELNDEWEDYKPAEPLIKDEKIRKAVRAWAEVNGVKQVIVEKDFSTYTFYPADTDRVSISVWVEPSLSNLSKDKTYTIAELCGEEEE